MALADIITKIQTDAESEAKVILEEAEKEAEEIRAAARDAASKRAQAAHTANQTAADAAASRITSAAAHDARLKREGRRAEIIGRVFAEAETLLSKLSDAEYKTFVEERAKKLKDLTGVVTVPKEREDDTKHALKAAGLHAEKIEVAPAGTLVGGFVLETNDALYDYSFTSLIKQARETRTASLSQELFGARG